ncbi:esterase-like activity of phytase family protein [Catenuloplanes japonicus]|uniref:esterase-like activity of phytase family protein n=1 Tax=Catenuloplanes japonicus TaxID=33876 RepID=UPI000A704A08|nr:esterase-like activity of phytase family protein [Catenuloplanes japonicus]
MKSALAVLMVLFSGGLTAPAPETVCTISDGRLTELSGLAATADGYVTVNDGADDPAARRIFFLDAACEVARAVAYPSEPRDTEDLALAPDGTVWIGDIGDNGGVRESIGLWRLAPGASEPVLQRYTYPDGARDAEALLLDGDGTPIIVSKDPIRAGLYVPDGDTLRKAGSFRIPDTSTSNPFGFPGRLVITGGAVSPDGTRVVLRTYADAFEFPVVNGDIIRSITEGTAERIPLPDEPQGESITYAPDGKSLLTVSEGESPAILRYPSVVPAPAPSPSAPPPASEPALTAPAPSRDVTTAGIAVAAGAGLLVLGALGFGLARRFRRPPGR